MIPDTSITTILEYMYWHYEINIGLKRHEFESHFSDAQLTRMREQLARLRHQHPQPLQLLRWSPARALTVPASTTVAWLPQHVPPAGPYGPFVQINSEDHIQITGLVLPLHEINALRWTCKAFEAQCHKLYNAGPDLRYMHHCLRCTPEPQWTIHEDEHRIQLDMAHLARCMLRFRRPDQPYPHIGESAEHLFHVDPQVLDDIIQTQLNYFYLFAFHLAIDRQQERAMLHTYTDPGDIEPPMYHESHVEFPDTYPQWTDGTDISEMYGVLLTTLPLQPWKIISAAHRFLHHRHLQHFIKYTTITNQIWTWQVHQEVDFNIRMSPSEVYILLKNIASYCQQSYNFTNSDDHRDIVEQQAQCDRTFATTLMINYYKDAVAILMRPKPIATATIHWMRQHNQTIQNIMHHALNDNREYLLNYHYMRLTDFGHSGAPVTTHPDHSDNDHVLRPETHCSPHS